MLRPAKGSRSPVTWDFDSRSIRERATDLGIQEFRPYQLDAILEIADAFRNGRDYVILEAPTGTGKTIVAAALALCSGARTLDTASTLELQEQKKRILGKRAELIKGRRNYVCEIDRRYRADVAPCVTQNACPEFYRCDYYDARKRAERASYVITNHAYAMWRPWKRPFDLLVIDEVHDLEDTIVQAYRIDGVPEGVDLQHWAKAELAKIRSDWSRLGDRQFVDRRDALRAMKLRAILDLRYPWRYGTTVAPLWARGLCYPLFDSARYRLLMSATPGDPELLAWRLGIPWERVAVVKVPSCFPPENRPVHYKPLLDVDRRADKRAWEYIAYVVRNMADFHSGRKGIVHVASWQQAILLHSLVGDDRIRLGNDWDSFRTSREPLVVISPSAHTGLDFPYIIGWQLIVKIPWPDLGDPFVSARENWNRRWYIDRAATKTVQAAGRAVRTPDDEGITYIIDRTFERLEPSPSIPEFFREALRR